MKVSASALLLAVGASDAFTSPSPSKPALTVLQVGRQMSGGIEGSNLMNDRLSPPDINAPWGRDPVHNAPQYSAPSAKPFNSDYIGGESGSYLMNGGTRGSSLLAGNGQVHRDAPWGNKFPYAPTGPSPKEHPPNFEAGGIIGSTRVSDGRVDRGASGFGAGYYKNHASQVVQGDLYNPVDVPEQTDFLDSIPMPPDASVPPMPPDASVPPPPPAGPAPWSKGAPIGEDAPFPVNPTVQYTNGNNPNS